MACIEKIYSVTALLDSSTCNANCSFCSTKALRQDTVLDSKIPATFKSALMLSARYGGYTLTLTGSGEPTCSPHAVTKALKKYAEVSHLGAFFPNVVLESNGIMLANEFFCEAYLPRWKYLGLTAISVSIHDISEDGQARACGINFYPSFQKIFENIRKHGLQCKTTILLRNGAIDNAVMFQKAINMLQSYGVHNVTGLMIGDTGGTRNELSLTNKGIQSIKKWLKKECKLCHNNAFGNQIYDYNGSLIYLSDYTGKYNPNQTHIKQLVVYQNGLVSYDWIKKGTICIYP